MARGGARGGDQAGIGGRDRLAGEQAGEQITEYGANAYNRAIMELRPRCARHTGNVALRTLAAALEKRDDVRLGYLFGSLARGTARTDSDNDVALSLGRPMTSAAQGYPPKLIPMKGRNSKGTNNAAQITAINMPTQPTKIPAVVRL